MRRWHILIVLALAATMLLTVAGRAFAGCSSPCPKGMNCIQVCNPLGDLW